jgi:NAD(P)-dependent dehydrogenase (short-subunit alcohol dehydrogenase family)
MTVRKSGIRRREFVQLGLAASILSSPLAQASVCRGPQPRPEGDLAYSSFDVSSTAAEVTAGIDLKGKTALITGCNSGLGSVQKAEQACASIDGATTPMVAELSDFASVKSCAEEIQKLDTPIDMLICNAGIMALPRLTLSQGLELQFVVNHLGHFLLTTSLLEQVNAAEKGRIIILSSCAHQLAPPSGIDFDNLDGSKGYVGWTAYGRSKLANGLFANELARRLSDTDTTANSVHPGVIDTNLGRHLPDKEQPKDDKSVEQGAATQCYVAANDIPANITGQYFVDCNPAQANAKMYDPQLASKLWRVSEELIAERL